MTVVRLALVFVICLMAGLPSAQASETIEVELNWVEDAARAYPQRLLSLEPQPPKGVDPPAVKGLGDVRYGYTSESGPHSWLLAYELRRHGRLWVDTNRDGSFADETTHPLIVPEQGTARLQVTFPVEGGSVPVEITIFRSKQSVSAGIRLRAHRVGTVVLGKRARAVELVFNAPTPKDAARDDDRLGIDLDGDGRVSLHPDSLDRIRLARPFLVGAQGWRARVDAGAAPNLTLTPVTPPETPRRPAWSSAPMPPMGESSVLVEGAFRDAKAAYERYVGRPHPHRLLPELARIIRKIGEAGSKDAFSFLQKQLKAWEETGKRRDNLTVRVALVKAMGNGHYARVGSKITKIAKTAEEPPLVIAAIEAMHGAGVAKREKTYAAMLKKAEHPRVIEALERHLGYLGTPSARKILEKRLKQATEPPRVDSLYRSARRYGTTPPDRELLVQAASSRNQRAQALGLRDLLARQDPETYGLAVAASRKPIEDEALRLALCEIFGRGTDPESVREALGVIPKAKPATRARLVTLLSALRDADAASAVAEGLDAKPVEVRAVAAESLAGIGEPKTGARLAARLEKERSPIVLAAMYRALAALERTTAVPAILASTKHVDGDEDGLEAAVLALAKLPDASDETRAFFGTQLEKRAWDARILAVDALADARHPLAVELLLGRLEDEDRRVRAAAAQGLGRVRAREAVEPLIVRLESEEDERVRHAIGQALFFTTGQYLYDDLAMWQRWWKAAGASFEVPKEVPALPEAKDADTYGATFYGVPVASERIVFVLDQSGSMGNMRVREEAPDEAWTELERAVQQTWAVIETLGEKARANVVCFETAINPWKPQAVELSKGARKELKRWLGELEPEGSTNLYDALALAVQMKGVEEIYLLSDGQPGAGRYRRTADILREIGKLNRKRRVAIHCVSLGVDSALLRQLAEANNGNYVRK